MNNNENEFDNGFRNVSDDDTSVTGMDSSIINLSDPVVSENNNFEENGGFSAADNRSVEQAAGKHGGFVINTTEDNMNNSNNTISVVNDNNINNNTNINNNVNNNQNTTNNTNQPQVRKVVRKVIKKNNNNKKLIEIIIGLVIFIVLLIIIFAVFLKKPATAKSTLPKKDSQYYKVCTYKEESSELEGAIMEIAVGIYESNGISKSDIVIIWKAKKGKIKAKTIEAQEEAVYNFAMNTSLNINLGGDVTNKNNYFKDGRVFLTNTREYSTADYENTNELLSDFQSIGMKCN